MIGVLLPKLDSTYTLRLLAEMVSTDPVVDREGELAEYVHRELVAPGLDCWLQEVEPGRKLNFNGHTDTVPVCEGWETDPFVMVTKDGPPRRAGG